MSQKDCIAKFLGKINHNELMDTAAEFEKRGQSANDAMLSAVQDKIDELEIEQTKVMKAVREAWVKDGGKEAKKAKPVAEMVAPASASARTNTGDSHSITFQEALDAGRRGSNEFGNFVNTPSFLGKLDELLQIPVKSSESRESANSIDGLPASGKSSLNDVRVHVEAIRNLLQGIAAAKQNLSMADVETQRLVLFHVLALSKNRQVLQSVVQLVPVDVVNDLRSRQLSPDSLFNNSSVVSSSISGDLGSYVPALSKAPETFIRAIALAGAEVSSRRVVTNLEGPTKDGAATSGAGNSDLRHGANYTRNDGIKTKETDKGVAMYSRSPFGTPTTVTALQSAIKELTGVEGKNQLGKVVATTASEIKSTWEPLIGQSVNIESEGDAGAAQAFYDPKSKTVFLIADNIREGTETAVLAHELMHKHGQTVLGKEGWDRLHGVISTWANADQESNEYAVYNYARNKVEAVGLELSNQELFPYAVEAALKMGIKPDLAAGRGTVARWLESVRQNLKVVWSKITGKLETFKAQDMVNLAFGIAQMENPENSAYIKDFDNSDNSTTINSGTDQNERTAGNSESPGIGRQDAEQDMATSLGGEPAPRGWSSATRISREGRPITVYRGAAEPLHVNHFGKDSLGKASGNPSSGLGVWFTTGKGEAQTYGKASSHNLDIRNPKLIRADELPGFDSVDDAHAYRETLRSKAMTAS